MIILIAHRGFSGVVPENTLAAFEEAIWTHPDALELDIQATRDGHLVVMHDSTVDRTTNGSGKISEMTLEELRALDAGSWKGERWAGQKIPLFREALELLKGRVRVLVELKHSGIEEQFVEQVRAAGMLDQVSVPTFHEDAIRKLKQIEPTIPIALNVSIREGVTFNPVDVVERALRVGANSISINYPSITPELIAEGKLHGVPIWAWTVDTPELIEKMVDLDVDAITSNFPDRAREVLVRRGEAIK